jgi:hypothetical protein
MCAAAATAPPGPRAHLREEGMLFWERLITECKEQIQAINSALLKHGNGLTDQVEMRSDEQLQLIRTHYPSTTVYASIDFERWGTVIRVSIRGHQRPDFGFYPEDFEMPLATDSDGTIVAVFDEGKSLRPAELAAFLAQTFRRCFPRIALPCSGRAVA